MTDPTNTPALLDNPQLVRDLAGSLRAAAEELGAVLEHLRVSAEAADRAAEQHAATAALWLERGDYSAAATACHRAHQFRLQAVALTGARSAVQP
jgi:hypothetical protein